MAVLNIRKLPDDVHARLRLRAAKAGRSMEAEARAILTDACREAGAPTAALGVALGLPVWVDSLFGDQKPTDVAAELMAERRAEAARE